MKFEDVKIFASWIGNRYFSEADTDFVLKIPSILQEE